MMEKSENGASVWLTAPIQIITPTRSIPEAYEIWILP